MIYYVKAKWKIKEGQCWHFYENENVVMVENDMRFSVSTFIMKLNFTNTPRISIVLKYYYSCIIRFVTKEKIYRLNEL